MLRRSRSMLCVVVVGALLAAACGGDDDDGGGDGATGDGASDEPTTVVVGTDAEPTTLDIQLIDDNGLHLSTWSVNEGLVDFDPDGNIEPILAASLPEQSEDDPTRWTVELREGIEFTNGEPFDAEAVVANVERILDEDYGSTLVADLATVTGAEAVDEYTVEIITDDNDPVLPNRLRALRMVPPVASQEAGYAENPIGTGPYMFESWQRGQRLTLEANPDYWGEPKPEIDTVEIRFIPDLNTRLAALENGEIDIAVNVPPAQAGRAPAVIQSAAGTEAGYIVFPLTVPPYDDPALRQAMMHAINVEEMNESLFDGQFAPAQCQPVVETAGGFNENLEPFPYDPDRARELLEEADLPDGFQVQFEGTTAVYNGDREIVEAISGYWRDIGLEVDTRFNEIDAYLEIIFDPEHPGVVYGESDQALNHASRQVGLFVQSGGQVARRGDMYSELDPLVDTALTAVEEEERQTAYDEIWQLVCDEVILGSTFVRNDITGVTERIDYEPDVGKFEKLDFHRIELSDG